MAFKEIRTYNLAKYFIKNYKTIYDNYLKQDEEYLRKSSLVSLLISLLDEICTGVIFVLVIVDTYVGNILIGDSVAYINVSTNIKSTLKQLLSQTSSIYNDNLYINQIFEFLDMPEEEQNASLGEPINYIDTIVAKDMSYRYTQDGKYVLRDINFSVCKGETIAIVGKNGAGKSTLIKILSALYDDYEGSVKINGIEMNRLEKEALRKRISILFQDFTKYELSLRENICVSNIEELHNDVKILQAIKLIDLNTHLDLSQQMGNWFNNGKNFSGGEWIKVGIGRVLFKNADLIILDEPNAALDAISEIKIFRSIKQSANDKICLVITHRISNIPFYADKIMVLDEGKIVDFNTHEYLLDHCELYRNLYEADLKIKNAL